jgi:hypothetical protein
LQFKNNCRKKKYGTQLALLLGALSWFRPQLASLSIAHPQLALPSIARPQLALPSVGFRPLLAHFKFFSHHFLAIFGCNYLLNDLIRIDIDIKMFHFSRSFE